MTVRIPYTYITCYVALLRATVTFPSHLPTPAAQGAHAHAPLDFFITRQGDGIAIVIEITFPVSAFPSLLSLLSLRPDGPVINQRY